MPRETEEELDQQWAAIVAFRDMGLTDHGIGAASAIRLAVALLDIMEDVEGVYDDGWKRAVALVGSEAGLLLSLGLMGKAGLLNEGGSVFPTAVEAKGHLWGRIARQTMLTDPEFDSWYELGNTLMSRDDRKRRDFGKAWQPDKQATVRSAACLSVPWLDGSEDIPPGYLVLPVGAAMESPTASAIIAAVSGTPFASEERWKAIQALPDTERVSETPGCDDDGVPSPEVADWVLNVYAKSVDILAGVFIEAGLPQERADRLARACLARLAHAEPPITVELLGEP